jgi:hypothetical protein
VDKTTCDVIDPFAPKAQAGKYLTRSGSTGYGKLVDTPVSVYTPEREECSIGVKSLKRNRISYKSLKNKRAHGNILHETQINRIARIQISTILSRNANALIRRIQHARVNNKLVGHQNLSLVRTINIGNLLTLRNKLKSPIYRSGRCSNRRSCRTNIHNKIGHITNTLNISRGNNKLI